MAKLGGIMYVVNNKKAENLSKFTDYKCSYGKITTLIKLSLQTPAPK